MHETLGRRPISRLPARWVRVGPAGRWAGFTLCGLVGLTLGVAWTLALASAAGRPGWLVLVLAGGMVAALLAVAAAEALVAGRPRLVCFHSEVAALAVAAGAVALVGQPVLASLDLAVPGLAIFLACGRVGCLVAGCCHGRPAAWGIRYGPRHVAEGLAPEYVGVPLFPVAAVEAVALVMLAGVSTAVVLAPGVAGAALASYLLVHLGVRFWLEFLRGDEGRSHLAGLSEAQWTAVVVTAGLCVAAIAGWPGLPSWLPLASAAGLAVGVALVATQPERVRLRGADHVRDLARVVRCADAARGGLVAATTGLGVRVSASHGPDGHGAVVWHYAFSRSSPALRPADAAALGRLATSVGLGSRMGRTPMIRSGNGVYHLESKSEGRV
jgi:Prolipoprotein diacylglyceryl transferase